MAVVVQADDKAAPSADVADTKKAPPRVTTLAELKVQSDANATQLEEDYQYVLRVKALVVKKKDVIKLNCVNDKLVQLKAQMNIGDIARRSVGQTEDAATIGDTSKQLGEISESSRRLREEANQCIGEPELFKQESGTEVDHPEVVDDPGVIDPYFPESGVDVEPPGYASAFG